MIPIRNIRMSGSGRRRARGFTLVEALVALLALSVGLLGIAGLQLAGLRANLSASWRTQATYLSYDIIDRMRANRNNRLDYVVAVGEEPDGGTVAEDDLLAWKGHLAATLPAGDGAVEVSPDDPEIMVITVQWSDSRDADDPPLVFTMRSRI